MPNKPSDRFSKVARRVVQSLFVLVVLYTSIGRQLGWKTPTVDALCPFGAIENLWHLLTSGIYIGKIFPSNMVIGGAFIAAVLVAGGAFCGWICPMGTLQDLLSAIRKRLRLPQIRISHTVEKYGSLMRFVVLFGILAITIRQVELVFASVCPYRSIFGLSWLFSPHAGDWLAYAIAGAIIVVSLFVSRFWCRFLCPLGAVVSVAARLSPARLFRNQETCTSCGLCERVCPMNCAIQNTKHPTATCNMCLECVRVCAPGSLATGFMKPFGTRLSQLLPKLGVVTFCVVIFTGSALGLFETAAKGQAFFSSVASGVRLDPLDIRGWMSLNDVSKATGVPIEFLLEEAGLPIDTPLDLRMSELERLIGFETDDAREIVAHYYELFPDTQIEASPVESAGRGQFSQVSDGSLRGRHTIDYILNTYDVSGEWLLQELGLPLDTPKSASLRSLGIEPERVLRLLGEERAR